MTSPLEPVWDAYQTALHAFKVVERCATVPDIDEERPFRNTRFHRETVERCEGLLESARRELNALVVLGLYAAFEARVREHLTQQGQLLRSAGAPDVEFGQALAEHFGRYCDEEQRMDRFVELFAHAVGDTLIAQVGQIRKYRHWVAHGRRGKAPPGTQPRFAYDTLAAFLTSAGLA
ncbi:MAG: hypothetical protein FJ291_14020 [Planctomycetes bacterium]|nr:hypothetical protein [Planctomycetota bacterium]